MSDRTVFILGAGASCHLGFPSGEGLLKSVINCNDRFSGWNDRDYNNLKALQEALKFSGLLSVDSFLEQNKRYEDLGKFLIALNIAKCEHEQWPFIISERDRLAKSETDEKNWYRELWRRIASFKEHLTSGRVSFITFNYDRSLEFFLEKAIEHTYYGENCSDEKMKQVYAELRKIQIVHLYGQSGYLSWQKPDKEPADFIRSYSAQIVNQDLWNVSKKIKLIRNDDIEESPEFIKAKELIKEAGFVYFLGFGFDQTNMDRLGRFNDVFKGHQVISGTAFGLGAAEIQRLMDYYSPHDPNRKGEIFPRIKIYEFLKEKIDWRKL